MPCLTEVSGVSDQPNECASFSSGELSAEVSSLGAQIYALRDRGGRDLLWNGDPAVWSGRAPLLFPIVGVLAGGSYRVGASVYRLSRHGFARGRTFELVESSPAAAAFRLKFDQASLEVYPFRFELDVRFALDGPSLSVTTLVRNLGTEEMPASFGYHPAFRWPLPFGQARSAHFIEFADDEPAPVRRLDSGGLLTPVRHPTPVAHRRLELADALFQDDVIIFDQIRSRSVTYGAQGGPRIRLSFPDSPYLGVWTKPKADFICIEPWHGVSDAEGFAGDFRAKTGVFMVGAGAALPIKMTITLLEETHS
jgi:galactose mutarotase-like enzyme